MEGFSWLIASDDHDFNEEVARFFDEAASRLTPRQRQIALYALVRHHRQGLETAPPKP